MQGRRRALYLGYLDLSPVEINKMLRISKVLLGSSLTGLLQTSIATFWYYLGYVFAQVNACNEEVQLRGIANYQKNKGMLMLFVLAAVSPSTPGDNCITQSFGQSGSQVFQSHPHHNLFISLCRPREGILITLSLR